MQVSASLVFGADLSLEVFKNRSNAQSAATAGSEDTVFPAVANELSHGKHADSRARGTVVVTKSDGAAKRIPNVHIDLLAGLFLDFFDNREILDRESLVALHVCHVRELEPRPLYCHGHGIAGRDSHYFGITSDISAGEQRSFVIADIPGVIEGAAEGAGLGIHFLKHLARTRLLLHVIDIASGQIGDIAVQARQVVAEVDKFGGDLAQRERWLVLNKCDLLADDELQQRRRELAAELDWQGPLFLISALTGRGAAELVQELMSALEQQQNPASASAAEDEQGWDPLS